MSADSLGATASGDFTVVIGDNSSATATEGVSIGANQTNTGSFATNVGNNNTVTGNLSAAYGTSNTVNGASAGVFGNASTANGANAYAVGTGTSANGANASAFGSGAAANFANSTAIGTGAVATRANQQVFGTATNTYTMPGITSAASLATQTGTVSFVTTDPNGNLAAGPSVNSLFGNIGVLSNRIHDVRQEARGGVGLAIATGQIRYDDTPGKVSIGVGGGVFEDEGGLAGGIGFTSPNGRFRGNISAGGTTNGDFGGGAGISITLN
jgi:autotransporter adhesin